MKHTTISKKEADLYTTLKDIGKAAGNLEDLTEAKLKVIGITAASAGLTQVLLTEIPKANALPGMTRTTNVLSLAMRAMLDPALKPLGDLRIPSPTPSGFKPTPSPGGAVARWLTGPLKVLRAGSWIALNVEIHLYVNQLAQEAQMNAPPDERYRMQRFSQTLPGF